MHLEDTYDFDLKNIFDEYGNVLWSEVYRDIASIIANLFAYCSKSLPFLILSPPKSFNTIGVAIYTEKLKCLVIDE